MPSDPSTWFVQRIVERCTMPAVRSDLRTGIGVPVDRAPRMHAHVAPLVRPSLAHETAARYCVAALIARRPDGALPSEYIGNLGVSIARATHLAEQTREDLVRRLTAQPASRVTIDVGRVVSGLRDAKVPVNFPRLLNDLTAWPQHRTRIATEWLQSYSRELNPITLPN
ncbi:type I-E CRISPR-associated protein Cse2/CasB [Saccharomonospora azurea]|uniref:type I-E CRISPR-associated protein Cse2/CasB n=1 Tax=Saccharomonospora azurea TaxID=40988 RepID=UPI00331D8E80